MTNVDFWRSFAANTDSSVKSIQYYFEHNRESLDFANLLKAEGPDDRQYKIIHFTNPNGIIPQINEHGGLTAMRYLGTVLILVPANAKGVIDVQAGTDEDKGRYTENVKPMIDNGGVLAQVQNFNMLTSTQHLLRLSDVREIFGILGLNGDGIMFKYDLKIEHDTPNNIEERAA